MSDRAPNDYALGHDHDELQRLVGQGRWLGELTEEVLRAAGIGPGMRVLDVGCGAGDVSFLAASLVGGIDRSPDAITLGAQGAGREKEGKLSSAACALRLVVRPLDSFMLRR